MTFTSPWIILTLCSVYSFSIPTTDLPTTRRLIQSGIGDTIKQLTDQLINSNRTSPQITLDTRTPPRVQQHIKKQQKNNKDHQEYENAHPGVAEPVLNADSVWEESTKKLNFYKIENKATTDQGISTWVLLNSQTVSPGFIATSKLTPIPTTKVKFDDGKNVTRNEIFNKITKPFFKKRPLSTTTRKPNGSLLDFTTQAIEQKLTKVKASVLNNAISTKNKTSTKIPSKVESNQTSTIASNSDTNLKIEPKEDDIELLTTTMSSKKRRTTLSKKKKNKNRRRPSLEKISSVSNITKMSTKQKPIGTQIYNYLSREIMPTVGVGLVGLMVTAGLASYFLYPFTPVRRSYDIDRIDKQTVYRYSDEYTPGGISEEEAIGKVIAGMPYKNKKNSNYGLRRDQNKGSLETIYLTPTQKYDDKIGKKESDLFNDYFGHKHFEHEAQYPNDNKVQLHRSSEVTPVVVPEHGPRSLFQATTTEDPKTNSRRRRSSLNENEIFKEAQNRPLNEGIESTTTIFNEQNSNISKIPQSFANTLKMLLERQIKIGLDLLQKSSEAIASYFLEVNKRFSDKAVDKQAGSLFK